MKTQIVFGMSITVLTLIGLFLLPSQYHFVLSVWGLGCASLAMVFALFISSMENPKPRYRRKG
jgi:uncharacterized protein (DUF58 family)